MCALLHCWLWGWHDRDEYLSAQKSEASETLCVCLWVVKGVLRLNHE